MVLLDEIGRDAVELVGWGEKFSNGIFVYNAAFLFCASKSQSRDSNHPVFTPRLRRLNLTYTPVPLPPEPDNGILQPLQVLSLRGGCHDLFGWLHRRVRMARIHHRPPAGMVFYPLDHWLSPYVVPY